MEAAAREKIEQERLRIKAALARAEREKQESRRQARREAKRIVRETARWNKFYDKFDKSSLQRHQRRFWLRLKRGLFWTGKRGAIRKMKKRRVLAEMTT
jgi:hypothetical protein